MKKILIIDEEKWLIDPIINEIESRIICEIHFAWNCSESIIYFLNNYYDHIILDLMLPVGNYEITKDIIKDDASLLFGLQLLKFFRSQNKSVNIIGYSLACHGEIKQAFIENNANFLCKLDADSFVNLLKLVTTKK